MGLAFKDLLDKCREDFGSIDWVLLVLVILLVVLLLADLQIEQLYAALLGWRG